MAADVRDSNDPRTWRRSSRCNQMGNCLEVGRAHRGVIIRDSKGVVSLSAIDADQWVGFLRYCRATG